MVSAPPYRWVGRVLTGLAIAFLVFDATIKFLEIPEVTTSFLALGYSPRLASTVGTLELVCVALYVWPRTSVLGAVVLTGYLGGAVAAHLRVGDPLFSHILFPTYVAGLIWGGLFLREERLRTLVTASVASRG
jgi:hypothetical protein